MKRVALLGSSGGNLHRLGGHDPAQLIRAVQDQLVRAGIELAAVCFVSADGSLDSHTVRSTGTVWTLDQHAPRAVASGLLTAMNDLARTEDDIIAAAIADGQIDGLILVSADPADINSAAVKAAAAAGVPAAGSGGSSVAAAKALGVRFVSASGTTGTTNHVDEEGDGLSGGAPADTEISASATSLGSGGPAAIALLHAPPQNPKLPGLRYWAAANVSVLAPRRYLPAVSATAARATSSKEVPTTRMLTPVPRKALWLLRLMPPPARVFAPQLPRRAGQVGGAVAQARGSRRTHRGAGHSRTSSAAWLSGESRSTWPRTM